MLGKICVRMYNGIVGKTGVGDDEVFLDSLEGGSKVDATADAECAVEVVTGGGAFEGGHGDVEVEVGHGGGRARALGFAQAEERQEAGRALAAAGGIAIFRHARQLGRAGALVRGRLAGAPVRHPVPLVHEHGRGGGVQRHHARVAGDRLRGRRGRRLPERAHELRHALRRAVLLPCVVAYQRLRQPVWPPRLLLRPLRVLAHLHLHSVATNTTTTNIRTQDAATNSSKFPQKFLPTQNCTQLI